MKKWMLVFFIFLFSFVLRLWNLNAMGRTWDEFAYVDTGFKMAELLSHGNVTDSLWYSFPDHPPLAKVLYGIGAHFDIAGKDSKGNVIYNYDWTVSRLVSVLFSSLSAGLVVLFGIEYFSIVIGVIAGIIFSILPVFIGLSQLVTLESVIMFFFTASVYSYIKMLDTGQRKWIIISGILTGCAYEVKFSNILLLPLLFFTSLLFVKLQKSQIKTIIFHSIIVSLLSFAVFFILWPGLWTHAPFILKSIVSFRFQDSGAEGARPNDLLYFFTYFFITTPIIILILFFVGVKEVITKKKFILYSMLLWFLIPFFQSFYSLKLNGIRYVIEIYAPLSILAAVGFRFIANKLSRLTVLKFLYFIPILIYLGVVDMQISPYYLSYYNLLVGGPYGVSQSHAFPLGWWGEGQPEAAKYLIQNGFNGMSVALAETPQFVMPPVDGINFYEYKNGLPFDYIVTNDLYLRQHSYKVDSFITQNYSLVHTINANGGPFIYIYRRIK